MTIDFPGHSAPRGSFEVPLEMLSACHARVEQQCAALRRLVPHLAAHGADADARAAAAAVMRYFDTSGQDHHADEEVDLFPALVDSMAGSDAVCLRELVGALTTDHRQLETAWQRVRQVLVRIAVGDDSATLEASDVEALAGLYERHIAREENELLPMAARLLSDDVLERIGRAMRERRHVGASA
jgi:hemerythrin-like domain-containing protein